ncbi:MAG: hypothetical protein HXX13_05440 [Bacteroidetes bacterium]|nr:hypothetical protein [Bacteroidota bacterium]
MNRFIIAKLLSLLGYLMALVYIGLGCALFLPGIYPAIPHNLKLTFSLFFIAYGLFRLVKLITRKNIPDE